MTQITISDRALNILKMIVEKYIREGTPVASKVLAQESTVGLSPATIRNIMADLEALGYLHSPHTSAGRIPTAQGYRVFVNSLVTAQQLNPLEVEILQQQLNKSADSSAIVEKASALLSSMTQLAGVVMLPRREAMTLRHVEFLPLSNNRILAILVVNEREVQNRIIHTERVYSANELQQAANYLTEHYAGKDLLYMREAILQGMHDDQDQMKDSMQAVVDIAEKAFMHEHTDDYVIAGQNNLLRMAQETGVRHLRNLFDAFNQKRDILHLLDQCLKAEELQIFIGEESGYDMLEGCSLVTAPYAVQGKVVGVLGVIGPTRMAYDRAISAVDITAKLLGTALMERAD